MYPSIPTPDAKMHPSERKRQQTVRQQLALEAFCRNNGKSERPGKSKAVAANTTPVLRRWFI